MLWKRSAASLFVRPAAASSLHMVRSRVCLLARGDALEYLVAGGDRAESLAVGGVGAWLGPPHRCPFPVVREYDVRKAVCEGVETGRVHPPEVVHHGAILTKERDSVKNGREGA